ncbi:hypothetical protein TBLA_0F03460 [Henningerozyma blattae CBS 6284]|uniref:AB hydrolase-1 domain-containing protein n=1 Tax=Henningerozyma blattae (strain ATCC 34711 / CBS 6284 / DSM 70876 / NBRC 10599 / NRRL Y-10934 / UCD 77-7) TaxID=1071380 RepID=I2H681_HENB6|nr:hypothetical protein TBLA_0F03460 [Tetrapisispora blattae CBS 6284]CCH61883.1 hypothetical protein TBLA_0F03460 [Tetrapisispora blattae CBS 6284]
MLHFRGTIGFRKTLGIRRTLTHDAPSSSSASRLPSASASATLKPSTAPKAASLPQILRNLPRLFPRSMTDSIRDYSQFKTNPEFFQDRLLSQLSFYPSLYNNNSNDTSGNDDPRQGQIIKTYVNENEYINEFQILPNTSTPYDRLKHLILIHGYGAGLGFYINTLQHLSMDNWCIHAVDLPGYGFSSRLKFPYGTINPRIYSKKDVLDWFQKRLKTWFHKKGLLAHPENNLVTAHSMGAYIMCHYLNNHPSDFRKIIMCSPAGFYPASNPLTNIPLWYTYLWDRNYSPFSLVRISGPLGSKLTSGWSYSRFFHSNQTISNELSLALHTYAYSIFNLPGSGEYSLSHILKAGGDPRTPLQEEFFTCQSTTNNGIRRSNVEYSWLYGQSDWINKTGGFKISQFLNSLNKKSNVFIAPNSGHHLYFDNYMWFNSYLAKEMTLFN